MSPEEKANEIYSAMLNAGKGLISEFLAKQCARIAVEEVLIGFDSFFMVPVKEIAYYKKVLTHLQ